MYCTYTTSVWDGMSRILYCIRRQKPRRDINEKNIMLWCAEQTGQKKIYTHAKREKLKPNNPDKEIILFLYILTRMKENYIDDKTNFFVCSICFNLSNCYT